MTKEEILYRLCYYDPRNPNRYLDYSDLNNPIPYEKSYPCYCDNCFGGKTELAEYCLSLLDKIEDWILELKARDK